MKTIQERARNYVLKMPPSIQGSGGSTALFNVALVLIKGFSLTTDEAWPLILRWNQTHCQPTWSEPKLRHKLTEAAKSTRIAGYLLKEREPHPHLSPDFESEIEYKARNRRYWPAFLPLTQEELDAIARLRKLPLVAVIAAARNGFLSAAKVDGHRCFIIHEGTFAQARRFDGGPLYDPEGDPIKAKNLPGSRGAFLGRRWLGGPTMKVLMVEGAIALIEALAAYEIVCPADGWTIVAATAAPSRFERDPELLRLLSNHFVRIIPDPDEAGLDAAASWLADLESVGCHVDAHPLPDGIKDLGPLVADPATHNETLNSLFS
jgi:hypothetical protein